MIIEFINAKVWGIDTKAFSPLIKRLQKVVDSFDGILNVIFVNDEYIRALNKQYRKKDKPTDGGYYWYKSEVSGPHIVLIAWVGPPQVPWHLRLIGPRMDVYGGWDGEAVRAMDGEWGDSPIDAPNDW